MSQKTDLPEFGKGFIWQVAFLAAIALAIVILSPMISQPLNRSTVPVERIGILPRMLAGAQTIENGLLAFSGEPPKPDLALHARALIGLLIASVLCPTVFLLQWRRRRVRQLDGINSEPWRISRIFVGLCGAFVLVFALTSPLRAIKGEEVRRSLREAQAQQDSRDLIINELNIISIDVQRFFVLPASLGGGNRNLSGYKLPQELTSSDEASYQVRTESRRVNIHAASKRFEGSWVDVTIDSAGLSRGWSYGGKFQ